MEKRAGRTFLYVPEEEADEAIALGAILIPGDARFVVPVPLPVGVTEKSFERWKGQRARYRWVMSFIARTLGDVFGDRGLLDEIIALYRRGAAQDGEIRRVHLWVCAEDRSRIRDLPGIRWDRRRKQFWAGPEANLNALFDFLTPEAEAAWRAE